MTENDSVPAGRLARLIPADPLRRRLLAIRFAGATGRGVFLSGSVVYFTLHVGLSAGQVGLGLSASGFAGLVSSVLFGMIADRVHKRTLLCALVGLVAVGFGLYSLVSTATEFYVLVVLIAFLDYGTGPTESAIVATLVPDGERVRLNAMMRSVFNIGFSAGIGVAAVAALSERLLVLIPIGSAVLLGAAAVLVTRLPAGAPTGTARRPRLFGAVRDLRYLSVVGLSAVLASHISLLMVVLPLWTLTETGVRPFLVPLLLVINTVFVIFFQVRASRGAETVAGAAATGRRAGLWIAAGCAAVSVTAVWHDAVLAAAAVVATVLALSVAEVMQASSAWGLAFGLAPKHAAGEYLGAFDLHVAGQNVAGPVLLSGLVIAQGFWGWMAVAGLMVAAALLIGPAARRSAEAMAAKSAEAGAEAPAAAEETV
ncbi:MFS transporter [Kitasatospora sp. NPDC048365]|uniref:MFS transporter n=1 Tax=Kitasatospora sp. NPDC048365 TaxID=3364050 RepID=UPI00371F51E4